MSDEILKSRSFDFPSPKNGERCDLLIIAGEHSGDEQAARMLKGILSRKPSLNVCAFGGKNLSEAGANLLFDMTGFSVVGLAEVLENYGFFKALFDAVVDWIKKYKPRVVCFVDYPGFNLRLAKTLKNIGVSRKGGGNVKLAYYISPQIWAWKSSRRFKMADILDALGVIFPFEKSCFADTSLPVTFVGHPFMSRDFSPSVKFDDSSPILLLAGSRPKPVERIFPAMLSALKYLPNESAVALYPTPEIRDILSRNLDKFPELTSRVRLIKRAQNGGQISAKAMLTSSGTMSLECCLAGIPGAIVYKANYLTYIVGRLLVKIKYLGISNIILDRAAWREFIQFDAKPREIAEYLKICMSPESAEESRKNAEALKTVLRAPNNVDAAEWILSEIESDM